MVRKWLAMFLVLQATVSAYHQVGRKLVYWLVCIYLFLNFVPITKYHYKL